MKFIKWETLIITSVVCLLPMLLGMALWEALPETIAIHFDINNNPDNYASKGFVVFGIPCLMVILQWFCCFVNDINAYKHGERKKFERVTKWIIPVMTIVLQTVTLGYALGIDFDIRRVAAILVGFVLIVVGNYLPKLDYIKNYDVDAQKARRINRFIGFETVILGLLFIVSVFLPPWATIGCIVLLVPYAVIGVWYGIKVGKK